MSTTDRPLSRHEIEGRPMTEAEEQYPLEPHLDSVRQGSFDCPTHSHSFVEAFTAGE
jgi:hypothetical protein